jgi:hypothetical protein
MEGVGTHTVRIDPIICSTIVAASEYAVCPRDAIIAKAKLIMEPERTRRGIDDRRTRVRSQPKMNATTKPPKKHDTYCMNFPTCKTYPPKKDE